MIKLTEMEKLILIIYQNTILKCCQIKDACHIKGCPIDKLARSKPMDKKYGNFLNKERWLCTRIAYKYYNKSHSISINHRAMKKFYKEFKLK